MKILVLNGPNLNLLGLREPALYGADSYDTLVRRVQAHCDALGVSVEVRQSNHEGVLVDAIQAALGHFDGIVLNPAAYTHTSVALLDALLAVGIPTVEVHLTDPDRREPFRRVSYVRAACVAVVSGQGIDGYLRAVDILTDKCGFVR